CQHVTVQLDRPGEDDGFRHIAHPEVSEHLNGGLLLVTVQGGEALDGRRCKLGGRVFGRLEPSIPDGTVATAAVGLEGADVDRNRPHPAASWVRAIDEDIALNRL